MSTAHVRINAKTIPFHDRGVFHARGAAFGDIIFVTVSLVNDLFRDNLLDDIFKGDHTNGATLHARCTVQQEQMGATCLAEADQV